MSHRKKIKVKELREKQQDCFTTGGGLELAKWDADAEDKYAEP